MSIKAIEADKILKTLERALKEDNKPSEGGLQLSAGQLNKISTLLGSGSLKTFDELYSLLQSRVSILIGPNMQVDLDPSDLAAFKEFHAHGNNGGVGTLEQYIKAEVINAISLYLHGTTRFY